MSSVVLQTVDIPCTTLTLGNPGCQWCYRRTTLSFSPSFPTPVHEQQHLTSQLARKYSRLCRRHSHTSKIVTLLFYFLQAGHPNEGTTVIKHAIHKQKVYTKQSEKWSFSWCKVRNFPNVTASRARTNVATYEDSLSLTTFPNPVCNIENLWECDYHTVWRYTLSKFSVCVHILCQACVYHYAVSHVE